MSLWAEVKRGDGKPAGGPSAVPVLEMNAHDPAAGKALIVETLHRIAENWNEIEACGGSIAWEWILRGSPHGSRIRHAESEVNRIGSKGNPAALKASCDAWVFAWRNGIEAWKRRVSATEAGQESIQKVRQLCER